MWAPSSFTGFSGKAGPRGDPHQRDADSGRGVGDRTLTLWGMGRAWGTPSTSGSGFFVVGSSPMHVKCVSFGETLSSRRVPESTAGSGSAAGRERAGSACHECGPLSPLIITFPGTKDQAGASRQQALARWGTGCRHALLAGVGFMGRIWALGTAHAN